jgi:hypothetical protein
VFPFSISLLSLRIQLTKMLPDTPSFVRRHPLFIIPSGQGRSSPARSKAFHRARYACDFGRSFKEGRAASLAATHKGRTIISQQQTSMTYIHEFEAEFQKKLEGAGDTASIVRWVSEKVLESYRNGITAGQERR